MFEKISSKINYSMALFPDYFSLKNKSEDELKKIRESWMNNFLHTDIRINESDKKIEFLFFRSLVRDDYKALINDVASVLDFEKFFIIEDYKTKTKKMNIEASKFLADHYWLYDQIKIGSPLINSCCFIRLIEYLYICQKVFSLNFKFLIAFADMQPVENILVQIAKIKGYTTVTLQHGLYIDYDDMDTVNTVNYKNHCADHFLAWGQETKKLIEKYHDSKVTICGKTAIYGLPHNNNVKKNTTTKNFLVVLDQRIFDEQNMEMLKIVFEYTTNKSTEVFVRFHPSNNKNIYLEKFKNIKSITNIDEDFIVIGHTSSMIYEALVLGYEAYRFFSSIPALEFPKEQTFYNTESLVSALKNGKKQNCGKQFIEHTGEPSKARYKDFFNSLSNGENS